MGIVEMAKTDHFHGKLAIQQRVLTTYRASFFDLLAQACDEGLSIFAGLPRPVDSITSTEELKVAHFNPARNINLLFDPYYLCFQYGIINWLEEWQPDVLVVETNQRYLSTPKAVHWMKNRGHPVLGWGLGAPLLAGPLSGFRTARRSAFLHQFDGLITYSHLGAEEFVSLGFPRDRIFIAPNAVSMRPTSSPPNRPHDISEKPLILFVGRLQARKRIEDLLCACATLSGLDGDSRIQPRLVIVGDGPERSKLEHLAKEIYPSAEFPGDKRGPELAQYFASADLFVLPGTGGLAVQEAMSYGLPVIMGQGDGTNDELVRPENGWQLSSPELLVETLQQALSDVSRLRAMGAESYRIVSQEINLERMAEVFIEAGNHLTSMQVN
jgi:glycosyltransferase involved in cell wall biosynthesis